MLDSRRVVPILWVEPVANRHQPLWPFGMATRLVVEKAIGIIDERHGRESLAITENHRNELEFASLGR